MRLSSCLDLSLRRRREKERESERGEREGERGGKIEREKREREREGGGKGAKVFKCGEGGTLCIETFCVRGGERLCQLCLKRQPVSS